MFSTWLNGSFGSGAARRAVVVEEEVLVEELAVAVGLSARDEDRRRLPRRRRSASCGASGAAAYSRLGPGRAPETTVGSEEPTAGAAVSANSQGDPCSSPPPLPQQPPCHLHAPKTPKEPENGNKPREGQAGMRRQRAPTPPAPTKPSKSGCRSCLEPALDRRARFLHRRLGRGALVTQASPHLEVGERLHGRDRGTIRVLRTERLDDEGVERAVERLHRLVQHRRQPCARGARP